jgi:hypothetical protein
MLLSVAVAVTAAAGNLDFEGLCTILGPTEPVPGVDSHNLCATSGFINSTGSCGTLEITQRGLMKLSDEYKGRVCAAHKQSHAVSTSVTGACPPCSWQVLLLCVPSVTRQYKTVVGLVQPGGATPHSRTEEYTRLCLCLSIRWHSAQPIQ